MSQWLRQSTVRVITFGPFLSSGDGKTLQTGAGIITSIDHATTGILLSKNGGAAAIREQGANFVASTYDAHGFFKVSLSAVDTNTLGTLMVMHSEPATYLSVWRVFLVVPAAVWDALFGSGHLDVNVLTQANIDFGALQKASLNAATPAGIQGTTQTLDALAALLRGADSDTLKTLSDQIDLQALEATLTAIKGTGWTTETLKAIKAAVLAASYTSILQGLAVTLSPDLLTVNLDGVASQLEIKSGEAKTITLTVLDSAGVAVNLSAAALLLGVKKFKTDTTYILSKLDAAFDKSLATQGIVAVTLTALETTLAARTYIGELKCSWTGPPAIVNKSADFFLNVKAAVT